MTLIFQERLELGINFELLLNRIHITKRLIQEAFRGGQEQIHASGYNWESE